jgi:hypothetical protein
MRKKEGLTWFEPKANVVKTCQRREGRNGRARLDLAAQQAERLTQSVPTCSASLVDTQVLIKLGRARSH